MDAEVKMRPLSESQYAKLNFRIEQAALSFPEKIRQIVEMQKRLVPIYASRGIKIVPWTDIQ